MKCFNLVILLLILFTACNPGKSFLGKKRLHEQYAQRLKDAGLDQTALGRQWLSEAETALSSPQEITLPYKEQGYFAAEKVRAAGLRFSAKRGEKILLQIERNPKEQFMLFAELWKVTTGGQPSFLKAVDTTSWLIEHEVDQDETYLLRLQPELLKSVGYTLSIAIGPTLDFPVPGGKVGSVWGDDRDAGARRHEGIDIFAPKRTPAVAAADGVISSVRDGGIGGKAIFMRPMGKSYSLYYAHLDEQLVSRGDAVKAGDTIGLVGNTGNAATTPPHLHFGIYAYGGAVDPFPFVNPKIRKPANVSSSYLLNDTLRTTTVIKTGDTVYSTPNLVLFPLAVSASSYRAALPDGVLITVPLSAVQGTDKNLRRIKTKEAGYLLDAPRENAVRVKLLEGDTTVDIVGYFAGYALVKTEASKGWLLTSNL